MSQRCHLSFDSRAKYVQISKVLTLRPLSPISFPWDQSRLTDSRLSARHFVARLALSFVICSDTPRYTVSGGREKCQEKKKEKKNISERYSLLLVDILGIAYVW